MRLSYRTCAVSHDRMLAFSPPRADRWAFTSYRVVLFARSGPPHHSPHPPPHTTTSFTLSQPRAGMRRQARSVRLARAPHRIGEEEKEVVQMDRAARLRLFAYVLDEVENRSTRGDRRGPSRQPRVVRLLRLASLHLAARLLARTWRKLVLVLAENVVASQKVGDVDLCGAQNQGVSKRFKAGASRRERAAALTSKAASRFAAPNHGRD